MLYLCLKENFIVKHCLCKLVLFFLLLIISILIILYLNQYCSKLVKLQVKSNNALYLYQKPFIIVYSIYK